jgi:hypothetical protein
MSGMLSERFAAAAHAEPLNDLSPRDRAELEAQLARAGALEDLPGRWQAALLQAETGAASHTAGCCCSASAPAAQERRAERPQLAAADPG